MSDFLSDGTLRGVAAVVSGDAFRTLLQLTPLERASDKAVRQTNEKRLADLIGLERGGDTWEELFCGLE